jgi:hypothetical protein
MDGQPEGVRVTNRNSEGNRATPVAQASEPGQTKNEQLESGDSGEAVFDSWPPESLTDFEPCAARMSSF